MFLFPSEKQVDLPCNDLINMHLQKKKDRIEVEEVQNIREIHCGNDVVTY